MLWRIVPNRVEFWQGSPDRDHTRIVYARTDAGWACTMTPWTD
ncbi:pyridoxine 5'-phosphate oxidase C-terminal domain-containing protein [Microbacterium sp. NPDC087592]